MQVLGNGCRQLKVNSMSEFTQLEKICFECVCRVPPPFLPEGTAEQVEAQHCMLHEHCMTAYLPSCVFHVEKGSEYRCFRWGFSARYTLEVVEADPSEHEWL